jgi:hypothetical protein
VTLGGYGAVSGIQFDSSPAMHEIAGNNGGPGNPVKPATSKQNQQALTDTIAAPGTVSATTRLSEKHIPGATNTATAAIQNDTDNSVTASTEMSQYTAQFTPQAGNNIFIGGNGATTNRQYNSVTTTGNTNNPGIPDSRPKQSSSQPTTGTSEQSTGLPARSDNLPPEYYDQVANPTINCDHLIAREQQTCHLMEIRYGAAEGSRCAATAALRASQCRASGKISAMLYYRFK